MADILLDVEGMKVYYPVKGDFRSGHEFIKAVDGVSFEVRRGEVSGIVGESDCGKSTLGRGICKLEIPTAGKIILPSEDISPYGRKQMCSVRKKVQMISQDPYALLNPRMSVFDIVAEPLIIHSLTKSKKEMENRIMGLLREVRLNDYHANRYPHEFSGGQRQRIGIAKALAIEPNLIIVDEPVSALDTSIQAQVLNLLHQFQRELNLTYIFVIHGLSMVEHISDRVGVMYLGNSVEVGDRRKLYNNPLHPYTQALLSAVPVPDPTAKKERIILEGSIPSILNPPSDCKFHTRCPECMDIRKEKAPERYQVSGDHYIYCHLYDDKIKENKEWNFLSVWV